MAEKIYLYPKWLRFWHLINALLILTLIVTGVSMHFATTGHSMVGFSTSVSIHNVCGILLTINYLLFIFGNIFTPNGRYYKFSWRQIMGDVQVQFKYYISGIFKHEATPFPVSRIQKFNPLQKVSYVSVMFFLVPLVFITGWGLLFPELLVNMVLGINGIQAGIFIHALVGYFISLFLIIHVYFCTVGATFYSNFRSMIDGYHEPH